jgi:MSHA biogenesis protein MshO
MKVRAPSHGFTLVEAIVAIVILGILAGIVAVFIRAPILGYRDSVERAEVTDQADLALRRMARDIRLALPNSVRVNGDGSALELLQTRSGARYLSAEDGVGDALALSFENPASRTFTAIGMPASFGRVHSGDFVVVYNLGPGFAPANAYQLTTGTDGGNIAQVDGEPVYASQVLPGQTAETPTVAITLDHNPFARQDIAMQSPQQRFQVVSGPVSFYCQARDDGTLDLWRAWGYGITLDQPVPPAGGQRALVASRLTRCAGLFSYATAAAQRTGLVGIDLQLRTRNAADPAIRLVHQVHVDNTP